MARKSDQRAAQLLHVAALHSVVLLLPDGDAGNQVQNWQPVFMETGQARRCGTIKQAKCARSCDLGDRD